MTGSPRTFPLTFLSLLLALAGCGGESRRTAAPSSPALSAANSAVADAAPVSALPTAAAEPPTGLRLPEGARPTSERLELSVDPSREQFTGTAEIELVLDKPHSTIWLHGKDLRVTRAVLVPEGQKAIAGTWEQKRGDGTVAVVLATSAPAGRARLQIEYGAPFAKQKGLYAVNRAGSAYAFTQFEPIEARWAIPCWDEPGFKIPYTLTLTVPQGSEAVANTREVGRKTVGDRVTVSFAPTLPIPSYLLAFAVGPFDVVPVQDLAPNAVRKRALSLRGVTTQGRGKEMAYSLAHTGELLALLETYFGSEYPYDKLDIFAVPGKHGAMENPGAVTFGEPLVLFDEKTAPAWQRQVFAIVMAHELAHMWVGDWVTMDWWDDTWLNEAFATWMAAKIAEQWSTETRAELDLIDDIQWAMGLDGLVSARSVRQPIASVNDIENAFDRITYKKGGGVLSMFERWLGRDVFRDGVRSYLRDHAFGNAKADDFLRALSAAAHKDVGTAFHTFLDQPGVPVVETKLACGAEGAALSLKQSRYLPAGSAGDPRKSWQIPLCARYGNRGQSKEACALLSEGEGKVALGPDCPEWVLPNAESSGYYRFALAPSDLATLRSAGLPRLSVREKLGLAQNVRAEFERGTLTAKDVLEMASAFVSEPASEVVNVPIDILSRMSDWLSQTTDKARVQAYERSLFAGPWKKLGFARGKAERQDRMALRAKVFEFLALVAEDPPVRAEAKRRAFAYVGYGKDNRIHPEAIDADLAESALQVAGEEADHAFWDALHALLVKTEDEVVRRRILRALACANAPDLRAAARDLMLGPDVRIEETASAIWSQAYRPQIREEAWQWTKNHFDAMLSRIGEHRGGAWLMNPASRFCDEAHAVDVERFYGPRVSSMDGGPRLLSEIVESIRICDAVRRAHIKGAAEFFARK